MAMTITAVSSVLHEGGKMRKKGFFLFSLGWPAVIMISTWSAWKDKEIMNLLPIFPWVVAVFVIPTFFSGIAGFWDVFLIEMIVSGIWFFLSLIVLAVLFAKWQIEED